MNFKIFFFLIIIALSSNSHAQWWQSGGNLIWPFGDVIISKGNLIVNQDIIAHGNSWDYEHQRLAMNGTTYDFVYWVDGTNGSDSNDGKTNATAYKSLDKVVEMLPTDLENNTAFICLPAGTEITLTQNVIFDTKNGSVGFIWVGGWIDSVSYADSNPSGLWLNPDSSSHQLISDSSQVLINTHGYNITLRGGSTSNYFFDSYDWSKAYGTNSHRHYYNRIVFYTDVAQDDMLTVTNCAFSNYNAWGIEIRIKNIINRGVVFSGMWSGWMNGFKILGDSDFVAINDWCGAVVFANNRVDFNVDRAWEPSGYYHPDYAHPVGELRNWEIEAMGERQLFAFEDTDYGRYNFWWMDYTQGDIIETGLPFIWIAYYGLANNTLTYVSSAMEIGTDRALNIHTLHNKTTDKPYQYLNVNLIQDSDTLKLAKHMMLNAIPADSTGLAKGMLYFNSSTGAIHRKF